MAVSIINRPDGPVLNERGGARPSKRVFKMTRTPLDRRHENVARKWRSESLLCAAERPRARERR